MNGHAVRAGSSARRWPPVDISPCNVAALEDLLDYLNSHLPLLGGSKLERHFSARSGRLVQRGSRIEAEVGPFLLRSEQRRIATVSSPAATFAWHRVLRATTRSGHAISADALLRLQPSEDAATAMDRLLRTLHMLNHLACATVDQDLLVHISLRHVLAVERGHGAFFEDLLRRCGLGPDRIVLVGAALPADNADYCRLVEAYAGYASRGFRIAIDLLAQPDAESLAALGPLTPAWLRVRQRDIAALRAHGVLTPLLVRGPGRVVHGESLSAGDLLELADYPVFLP